MKRVFDKLQLDPQLAAVILSEASTKYRDEMRAGVPVYQVIDSDRFAIVSEGYHFQILALMETPDFRPDSKWIADRLKLTKRQVIAALKRLRNCGLVKECADGKLQLVHSAITTTADVPNVAIQKKLSEDLLLAQSSLELDDVEERDFSSILITMNPERLREIKLRIQKFRRELCAWLEKDSSENRSEVFQLNTQIFQITRKYVKKPKNNGVCL